MTTAMRLRAPRGFTLIELMVAMTIGLIMVLGLASVFLYGTRNYRQDERTARMIDEMRFGMSKLTTDLEMAGFFTPMHFPTLVVHEAGVLALEATPNSWDCGPNNTSWAYNIGVPLEVLDNPTAAQITAAYQCIPANEALPGSDIVAIKRVQGLITPVADRVDGKTYLRTNGVNGDLYVQAGGVTFTVAGTTNDYEYIPTIYYVGAVNPSTGDATTVNAAGAVPALCRTRLTDDGSGNPEFQKECFAQGIESLQIEVGVDNNDPDFAPDYFTAAPDLVEVRSATAIRVIALVRSADPDSNYRNQKTYSLSNAVTIAGGLTMAAPGSYAPNDTFYRKIATTIVPLRDLTTLARYNRIP